VTSLTLYSRPGCHLCDEMKALVARMGDEFPFVLQEVDISNDPQLEDLYGLEIPVLILEGKKVAKYRISEEELRRVLHARAGGPGGAGEPGRADD